MFDGALALRAVATNGEIEVVGTQRIRIGENGTLNMVNTLVIDNTGDDGIHMRFS